MGHTSLPKTEVLAELILGSQNVATGDNLFTFRLTYPRFILAEVNTHRAASKNTSSSRAIPTRKMRKRVREDCVIPKYMGSNQKGMQAGEEIHGWRRSVGVAIIKAGSKVAVAQSWLLEKLGFHKQVSNRYLEPYSWVQQVFSATDLNNLLLLRNHPDAEPHFHELARQMARLIQFAKHEFTSMEERGAWREHFSFGILQRLNVGEWHLPFILDEELPGMTDTTYQPLLHSLWASTARCARTSYKLLDEDVPSPLVKDRALCEKLFHSQPMHLSPTEHPAEALAAPLRVGNFRGFRQYRKTIQGEHGGDEK